MNKPSVATVAHKVVTDATESELLRIMRSLHHTVLMALTETSTPALFNTSWEKCNGEDYKLLHQQSRAILSAKVGERKARRVAIVKAAISGVILTHMTAARAAKAAIDALPETVKAYLPPFSTTVRVPLSDIRPCFTQGESDGVILGDLESCGFKVTDLSPKGVVLVPFTVETAKVVKSEMPTPPAIVFTPDMSDRVSEPETSCVVSVESAEVVEEITEAPIAYKVA